MTQLTRPLPRKLSDSLLDDLDDWREGGSHFCVHGTHKARLNRLGTYGLLNVTFSCNGRGNGFQCRITRLGIQTLLANKDRIAAMYASAGNPLPDWYEHTAKTLACADK